MFYISLSSLIGLWPCQWVRDEREQEWEVFLGGLTLPSPTHLELLHAWSICGCVWECVEFASHLKYSVKDILHCAVEELSPVVTRQ